MSYDLFLKNKKDKPISFQDFSNYFKNQKKYNINNDQVMYGNENTGVYFIVDYNSEKSEDDDEYYPISININYLRPSIFGIEASIEIDKIVNNFNLCVFDPQSNGMGMGNFNITSFLKGWNSGNEFGYSTLNENESNEQFFIDTEIIEYAWKWNFNIEKLYTEYKEDIFIPRIMFGNFQNEIKSLVIWGDGIPINIPKVDKVILIRKELSNKLIFKYEEIIIYDWKNIIDILKNFELKKMDNIMYYHLFYKVAPKIITNFIRKQKISKEKFNIVSMDMILNKEIYNKIQNK